MSIPRWRTILDVTATVGIIAAAVLLLYNNWPRSPVSRPAEPPLPSEPTSIENALITGEATAKIVMIEFSEFQCPFCAKYFNETEAAIMEKYVKTGKLLIAFRHFPLEQLHPLARLAAEGAECAARQGSFNDMHNQLFRRQPQLSQNTPLEIAASLGLDLRTFRDCLGGPPAAQKVTQDQKLGKELGVTGTQTFFLGTLAADQRVKIVARLSGARRFADFSAAIEKALANTGPVTMPAPK